MTDINYRNIRNASTHKWYERALVEHLTMSLSPFLSILFIKKGVNPNTITVFMIICGIIAPLLFMVDNIYVRCVAAIIFLVWFTLDASDGEVARFTSTFSKHGRDLDFFSHISCHSLFVMAMWKIYAYESIYLLHLSLLFFILLSCELFYRMTVLYSVYVFDNMEATRIETGSNKPFFKQLIDNILLNLTYFPGFVVFFPALYCVSYFFDVDISPFFLAIFLIYILVKIKSYFLLIIRFYKS